MTQYSPVMAVLADESQTEFANQLAHALGYEKADIVVGSPSNAIPELQARSRTPAYILIDIGERAADILPELDAMAENCETDTRVVVVGSVNDVGFYRELRQRGIIEYFTRPVKVTSLRTALMYGGNDGSAAANCTTISFMSAASGDGASTIALNTAWCLAEELGQKVVIIDMDFQFGMIARSLDLASPFGIKEIFEHPDRLVDATLVKRMLAKYGDNLRVIAAPSDLRLMPVIRPETIRDVVITLREDFDFIIIDIPHVWSTWVAAALSESSLAVMVAQLWLRSVTHSARLTAAWREIGMDDSAISVLVNRSGAKFKEGVRSKDFERVCDHKIDFFVANDIKSVSQAENQGKTILEVSNTLLAKQLREFASRMLALHKGDGGSAETGSGSRAKSSGINALFSKS